MGSATRPYLYRQLSSVPEEHNYVIESSSPSCTTPSTRVYTNLPVDYDGSSNNEHHFDYMRGWAWQQVLLHQRLQAMAITRRNKQANAAEEEQDDNNQIPLASASAAAADADVVLLLEHSPVYTLGRGADESNLICLSNDQQKEERHRLARRPPPSSSSTASSSPRSARLIVDRETQSFLKKNTVVNQQQPQEHVESPVDDVDCLASYLSERVQPVMVPAISHIEDNENERGNHTMQPEETKMETPIYRIDRGGEVTYHGPGQLVVYPLLDLSQSSSGSVKLEKDLHWYLRQVEEVIIEVLDEFGIEGHRDETNTGVWVDMPLIDGDADDTGRTIRKQKKKKIAAIGVSASKWITTHGFALNVHPNLNYFDTSQIIPCGIEESKTISHELDESTETIKENSSSGLVIGGVTSMHEVLSLQLQQKQHIDERLYTFRSSSHSNDNEGVPYSKPPSMQEVSHVVLEKLEKIFGIPFLENRSIRIR